MKQGFKLLAALLLTLILAVSATAQINWMKQDGSIKYLSWADGSTSKTIYSGNSATFATGYFGSTISQVVHLTVTINNVNDGKIVSTIVSKDVNVNPLGYEVVTVLPEHYKKAGEYIIVIKLKDANTESVDTSLYLKVKPSYITQITPIPVLIQKNTAPEMNYILNKQVTENSNLQFTVSGTDEDNDDLEYIGEVCRFQIGDNCFNYDPLDAEFNGYEPATLNKNTGAFKWKPSYGFVQHFSFSTPNPSKKINFRFRTDDGDKKSAWEEITITVNDKNRNPHFNYIGNKVVQEEQLLQFTVNANDADEDELVYSVLSGLPPEAVFDADLQQFKWIPNEMQSGLYFVTFKVADNFGGKNLKLILITVTDLPVNEPQCDDGTDNDNDTLVDEYDPGCHSDGNSGNGSSYDPNDNNETDDPVDQPQCNDGTDNDNDALVDEYDPGCHSDGNPGNGSSYDPNDNNETDDPVDQPQCDDNLDNDGDGETDFPNDQGCTDEDDDNEGDEPQCNDSIDNDGDGKIDYPQDTGCLTPDDNDENDYIAPEDDSSPNIDLQLKSVHLEDEVLEAGNTLFVNVQVFNNGDETFDDLKVQAKIFDLGVWGSTGKFTLKSEKSKNSNVFVNIPADTEPGLYLVKVTAKNSHHHTSTYRSVYVESNTFK